MVSQNSRPRARRSARRHGASVSVAAVAVVAALVGVVGSCSDDPAPTVGAYCDSVRANLQELVNPNIATTSDIEATIDRYRSIADVAPLAVEPEWRRVIEALETAATVVPSDPASMEIANRAALAALCGVPPTLLRREPLPIFQGGLSRRCP